jgi:hypothetical protein
MANNHSLKIFNVQILKNYDNKQDVVNKITFAVAASNGTNEANVVKNIQLDTSKLENFVSFDQLTETQVKNWITSVAGDEMQVWYAQADQELQNLITPNELVVNPPWIQG